MCCSVTASAVNKQLSLWDGAKGGQSYKSTCPHDNHWAPTVGLQEVVPHLLTHTVVGSTICGDRQTQHMACIFVNVWCSQNENQKYHIWKEVSFSC